MAEPWEERVAAAIIDALEGIVVDNANFWLKPHVERTHELGGWLLTPERPVIFALAPVRIETGPESSGEQIEETPVIAFMLAAKHEGTDEAFKAVTPLRWTVQNRLFATFKNKILKDVTLGGLTSNINFRETIFDAEQVYFAGWDVVIGQIAPTNLLIGGKE